MKACLGSQVVDLTPASSCSFSHAYLSWHHLLAEQQHSHTACPLVLLCCPRVRRRRPAIRRVVFRRLPPRCPQVPSRCLLSDRGPPLEPAHLPHNDGVQKGKGVAAGSPTRQPSPAVSFPAAFIAFAPPKPLLLSRPLSSASPIPSSSQGPQPLAATLRRPSQRIRRLGIQCLP